MDLKKHFTAPSCDCCSFSLGSCSKRSRLILYFLLGIASPLASCQSTKEIKKGPVSASLKASRAPDTSFKIPVAEPEEGSEHKSLVDLFGGIYHSIEAEHLLNQILGRLSRASGTPADSWRVTILNSANVNAFATTQGNLYITRGLLALANDSAEVAAVMAHEIAHVTSDHASQRARLQKEVQAAPKNTPDAVPNTMETSKKSLEASREQTSFARFSRQQELEADHLSLQVLAKAGYDPFASIDFLKSLGRSIRLRFLLEGQKRALELSDGLSTHPSTAERIEYILKAIQKLHHLPTERGREEYLLVLRHLRYGEDPRDGYVRGYKFFNPAAGFMVSVPKTFILENTSKALLAISADNSQQFQLDRVKLPRGMSQEEYVESGWAQGLDKNSLLYEEVQGRAVLTGKGKNNDLTFRIALISMQKNLYRLIFIAATWTETQENIYYDLLKNIRPLRHKHSSYLRSFHLEIVTAKPTDTPQTLTRGNKTIEHPLEHFRLINNLEAEDSLIAGEKYKIIVD